MYKYLLIFALALVSCTNHKQYTNNYLLYIGTYTDAGSEGIYRAKFNSKTGNITVPELAATITNPSFQCITNDRSKLWSVCEATDGTGRIQGFNIDLPSGKLNQFLSISTEGNGPCFVDFDEQHHMVLAANYGSGNVFGRNTTGSEQTNKQTFYHQHQGNGPNIDRQEAPHAHSIKADPNGKFVYSADLGTDKIYVYTYIENELVPFKEIEIKAGSGPRHFDFHPQLKAMAVVNELNGTVTLLKPDSLGCFDQYYSTTTTLPADFTAFNKCADIHFSPNGKFLYASNRGHNSLVIYKVDQETMNLEIVGWEIEMINWPRNFTIEPSGNYLLVANKDANNITVYTIDEVTGLLNYTGNSIELSKPVCLNLIKISK